jgi:excisionase family DNA binding protein
VTCSATLLTASELATHLRVTRRWVYDQVESHGMPAYRLGPRALRFDLAAVTAWLEGRKVGEWQESAKSCPSPISRVPL